MKHLFLSLIMAVAMIAAQPVNAAKSSITTKGDTTIIIDAEGDTAIITSKVAGLVEKIVSNELLEHLDDTIVNASGNAIDEAVNDIEAQESNETETLARLNDIWARTATEISFGICFAMVFITFFVLLFRYMNRRRKYKVMEKAIENNYQLPEGAFGNGTKVIYNTPQFTGPTMGTPVNNINAGEPVQGTPVPPPFRSYNTPGATAQQPQQQPVAGQPMPPMTINWSSLKGVGAAAAGLGGIIFGVVTDATPISAIFCIPFFIGAFKMFTSYMDQRNAILAAQYYAQAQPQQPVQQQQPAQQPVAPAQPTAVPAPEQNNQPGEIQL